MKKIPTLFVRDATRRFVTEEYAMPLPEGAVATAKYDGTCVMFDGADWWARREVKPGKDYPPGFVELDHDDTTGKTVGWVPMADSDWRPLLDEAVVSADELLTPGTYELVGPKVNGNPMGLDAHYVMKHGESRIVPFPTSPARDVFDAVLRLHDYIEGVVWWFDGEPVAKLKKRDIPRGASSPETEGGEK